MTVSLTWSAPTADKGAFTDLNGSTYTIRWSSGLMSFDAAFSAAVYEANLTTYGVVPGQTVGLSVGPLDPSVTWYFAMKTTDTWGMTSALSVAATAQSYFVHVPGSGGSSEDAAWADYDRDGDYDFVTGNTNPNAAEVVMRNTGGVFSVAAAPNGNATGAIAWGDFDSDGDPDILVGNYSAQSLDLIRYDGGSSFFNFTVSGSTGHARQVAVGDLDNDGDLDAFVANGDSAAGDFIVRNDLGTLNPYRLTGSLSGMPSLGAALADFDNDGDLDVFVGTNGDEHVLRNEGGLVFTKVTVASSGGSTVRVAVGDLDGDGDVDAVAANGGTGMKFLRNDGGVLVNTTLLSAAAPADDVAIGDLDNDGDLDVLGTRDAAGHDFVMRNDGGGSFVRAVLPASLGRRGKFSDLADYDRDGDLDVLLAEFVSGAEDEHILRNDVSTPNTPPSAPLSAGFKTFFSYAKTGSTLAFTWEGGSYDGAAASATLRFALAVSRSPLTLAADGTFISGGSPYVVPPMDSVPQGPPGRPAFKDWGDGTLRHGVFISSGGAFAGSALQWNSTYYYRVQTIDAGLSRSSWSTQASLFLLDPCATRRSINDGQWSNPSTWDWGQVPTDCSAVIISSDTQVTVDITSATASTTSVYGALLFSLVKDSTLSVTGGDLSVYAGGTLEMGGPISGGALSSVRKATLVLPLGSVAGTYGLLVKEGGSVRLQGGADKSPFGYAVEGIPIGQSFFRISPSSAANWAAGDRLLIARTQGGGASAVDEHFIASVSGVDPLTVNLTAPVTATRVLTSTTAIAVANLTRNVVIRSSGTNFAANTSYVYSLASHATGFIAQQAEFVNMGANYGPTSHDDGLKIGVGAQASFSSCVVRGGSFGLMFDSAASTVSMSVVAKNNFVGVQATGGLRIFLDRVFIGGNGGNGAAFSGAGMAVTVSSSVVAANGGMGLSVEGDSVVSDNRVFANAQHGIQRLGADPGAVLRRNVVHQNLVDGFNLTGPAVLLEANLAYGNGGDGVDSSAFGVTVGNRIGDNAGYGLKMAGLHYAAHNTAFANGAGGFHISAGSHALVDNYSYSNLGNGVIVLNSSPTWAGGAMGRNPSLVSAPNAGADLNTGAFVERVIVRDAWLGTVLTGNMTLPGDAVVAFARDRATGTVQVWGDYSVEASTLALDYASRVWSATATMPVLIRGAGHSVQLISLANPTAVSQMITFERRAGQWHVDGSVGGGDLVAPFSGSQAALDIPTALPQMTVNFTEGAAREGDRLSFLVIGASQDVGMQKKLFFNDGNAALNAGRSRLRVAQGGGLELRGVPGFPTVVDRLDAGATYYTIITSGSFTAEYSSITNVDSSGVQFIRNPGSVLSLSTSTFDFMGVGGATGSYLTVNWASYPTVSATFYALTFGTSRSTAASAVSYNIRVLGSPLAAPPFPTFTLRQWKGFAGGERYDGDALGDELQWAPFRPGEPGVSTFTAITTHSITSVWTQGANDEGLAYEVQANTYPFANEGLHATFTYTGFTAPVAGLSANTSYYLRVFAALQIGPDQWDLEFSPDLNFPATATLAVTPSTHPAPFLFVTSTSATLGWHALPTSPLSQSASGYILEASTTNFDGTGAVLSSVTYSVLESTLTVGGPGGLLLSNSTYYFRVGSLNPFGAPNYIALGATATLATAVAPMGFPMVGLTSATYSWTPKPASPPDATSEGYLLQVSTSFDFSGLVLTSATPNVAVDRLTVTGLQMAVQYYARVGALNWNGVPGFGLGAVQSTTTQGWSQIYEDFTNDAGRGVAWGDHNGDGTLDLVHVTDNQDARVFGNGGAMSFVPSVVNVARRRFKPLWCDTDNDGDLDLYLTVNDASFPDTHFRNDGGGLFSATWGESVVTLSRSAACADFDGDGLNDIAIAVESGPERVYRNLGDNLFADDWNSGTSDMDQDVVAADFDGDGDVDLVFSGGSTLKVYRNEGNMLFAAVGAPAFSSYGVAAGDMDGDGDLDLVLSGMDGSVPSTVLRNDAGTFTSAWDSGAGLTAAGHVSVADFDADGRLDFLTGNLGGGPTRIYRSTGAFGFELAYATQTSVGTALGTAWGDGDNDGTLDFAAASQGAGLRVFRGTFSSGNRPPTAPGGVTIRFAYGADRSTMNVTWEASDYDGPGSSAAVTYAVALATQPTTLHPSLTRFLTPAPAAGRSWAWSPMFGTPLNGHQLRPAYRLWPGESAARHGVQLATAANTASGGLKTNTTYYARVQAIDASLARSSWSLETTLMTPALPAAGVALVSVGYTTATYSWTPCPAAPQELSCSGYVLRASTTNFNGAGVVLSSATDVRAAAGLSVSGLDSGSTWFFELGTLNAAGAASYAALGSTMTPGWLAHWESPGAVSANAMAAADQDVDGKTDAVYAAFGPSQTSALVNDGTGRFSSLAGGLPFTDARAMGWGDMDNDGDPDLIAAVPGANIEAYRNDGSAFSSQMVSVGGAQWFDAAWGDFNNDGLMDAVIVNNGGSFKAMRQVEPGAWTTLNFNAVPNSPSSVAVGDFDNDGWQDLAFSRGGAGLNIWRNGGGLNGFSEHATLAFPGAGRDVAWADLDGDGDLDLVESFDGGVQFHKNNGGDGFVSGRYASAPGTGGQLAVFDFDDDGLPDVLRGSPDSPAVLFRSTAPFAGVAVWTSTETGRAAVTAADFDGDSAPDILLGSSGGSAQLRRAYLAEAQVPPTAPGGVAVRYTDGVPATFQVTWSSGAYDAGHSSAAVHFAVAAASKTMTLSGDGRSILSPAPGGAKFVFSPAYGSPFQGHAPRPSFKTWPGETQSRHGVFVSTGPNGQGGSLLRNTTYYVRVQAVDAGLRRSSWSLEETVTTPARAPDGSAVAAVFFTSATVSWTPLDAAPQHLTGEGYRVEASTAPDFTGTVRMSSTSVNADSSALVTGLDAGTTYYFRVGSLNWQGAPSYAASVSTITAGWLASWYSASGNETPQRVAAGDYNRDGWLDFAVARGGALGVDVWRNDGGGTFTNASGLALNGAVSVAWGDVDGDGLLDLAGAGDTGGLTVWRGPSFSVLWSFAGADSARDLAWADFDGDGDQDLLVCYAGPAPRILRNDGGGTFSTLWAGGTGADCRDVDVADVDGDGDADFAAADIGAPTAWYRNDGGTFTATALINSAGAERLAFGDQDVDGSPDLALLIGSAGAKIFRNSGAGFSAPVSYGLWSAPKTVAWSDFNADGFPDLLLSDDNNLTANANLGGASFDLLWSTSNTHKASAWGDFDGDLVPDIVGGVNNAPLRLLRGSRLPPNSLPLPVPAPDASSLAYSFGSAVSTFVFTWPGNAYDTGVASASVGFAVAVATEPITLSVNNRRLTGPLVFTVPGGTPGGLGYRPAFKIWPGEGSPRLGYQAVVDLSTSGFLSDATYYIRVQAVDATGIGGPWSVQTTTFVFRDQGPGLAAGVFGISATNISVDYTTVPASSYFLDASTAANFTGTLHRNAAADPTAPYSAASSALSANTTYYLRMGALWQRTTGYTYMVPPATATLAEPPGAVLSDPFPAIFETSMTVRWNSGGNPVDVTTYVVHATTGTGWENSFSGNVELTTAPAGASLSATLENLLPNTTYMVLVYARNHNGVLSSYVNAGTTVTRSETPSAVVFSDVSTHSLVAVAHAPTPAFRNLGAGLSGTNIAQGVTYAGWHGERWTGKAVMPTGRHFLAAAVVAGRIHAIGGNRSGNRSENQAYDPVAGTWDATPASMPFGQTELGGVSLGGLLYQVGGYSNSSEVRAYDPGTNLWTVRADLTNLRWLAGTEVLDGKIYAVSGANGFGSGCGASYTMTATVEAFDPVTGLWSARAPIPGARMDMGTAVLGGRLHVFDGCNFGGTNAVYDPVGNAWATAASVPVAQGGARAAVVGRKAYYIGGAYNQEFDASANAWTQRQPLLTNRSGIAVAAFRGRIYAIGGASALGDETEEYDPGVAQHFGGLAPNTQYTFTAKSRNVHGLESGEVSASTYTLAAVPSTATPTFVEVNVSSALVAWTTNGNPFPATEYRAQASTSSVFDASASSRATGWTTDLSTRVAGLSHNTTWYFRVQARNADGIPTDFAVLGATATRRYGVESVAVAGGYSKSVWGDYDADGDLDALFSVFGANSRILRNDGGGTFTDIPIPAASASSVDASWADIDGDGDLDFLLATINNEAEIVGVNDGGTFTLTSVGAGGNTRAAVWGDFDQDGDQDALLAFEGSNPMRLLRNTAGVLASETLTGTNGDFYGVTAADFDNDGDLDAVALGYGGGSAFLRGNGDGSFAVSGLPALASLDGRAVDIDGDGDQDVVASRATSLTDKVLINDGAGGFTVSDLPQSAPGDTEQTAWADYDADGDFDGLMLEAGSDKYVLRNDGGFAFSRDTMPATPGNAIGGDWGDYDGDGDLDALVANNGGTRLLLRDDLNVPNSSPSAPGAPAFHLAYDAFAATLTVTWAASPLDVQSSTAQLGYALTVTTAPMALSPDGQRVVFPSSAVVAWNYGPPGPVRRPAFKVWPGEAAARHGLQFRLDVGGLAAAHFKSDTTYYFRLAAVDSGLARSSWSLESSTYVFRAFAPSGRLVTEVSTHSLSVAFGTTSASAHMVEASTAPNFSGTLGRFTTSDPAVVVATLSSLSPNTTYFVRAGTLWRAATAYAFAVPASTATDPAAPQTAVSTFPVVDSASMTVVWDGAGNPLGITTYTVVLTTSNFFPTSGTMTVTAATAPSAGPAATLFGLKDLTTYYLFVRAVGHSGTASAYTALGSTVTPPDLEPPAAVTDLRVATAALAGLFVDLAWSAPGDDGTFNPLDSAEYRVDYSTYAVAFATQGAEVVLATSSVTPGERQSLRVTSLAGGTTYYFRVFARDNSGNWSALSNGATVFLRWSSDTVSAGRAQVTGLAGPDGTQHLFFNDGATTLKHAFRAGDVPWTVEDVTVGLANLGVRSAAAIDSSGTIHLVYTFSSPANQVRYKSWAGAWSAQETVFTGAGPAFEAVSMGVDAAGRVHVAFVGGAATELRYAVRAATGGWVSAGLDGALGPSGVDLELKPDGTPLIAYGNGAGRLRVAEGSPGGFNLRTVDESVLNQQAVSLTLSGGGGVGVFFKDSNDATVKLATAAALGGPWTVSSLDGQGAGDPYLSGVLDGAGNAHVVYGQTSLAASQTGAGDLFYRGPGASGADRELVDRAGGIGSNGQHYSVFIDTSGTVLASYVDSAAGPVKVSSITGSRVPPPGTVLPPGGFTAAALHQTSATWGWVDRHPSEIGFRVYGGTEAPFTLVAATTTLGPGSASFLETGLLPNTTYFRYAAVMTDGGAGVSLGTTAVTRAFVPAAAASTWTVVLAGSLEAAWGSATNPAGTLYEAVLSSETLPNLNPGNVAVATVPFGAPGASFSPLTPNTTYYLAVRAVSHAGIVTDYASLGSTHTLAAVPEPSTRTFAGVFQTSMTVQWSSGTNPAWTEYRVDAATSADFGGLLWSTSWEAFTSTTVLGLTRNTTYYARVQARNLDLLTTAYLALGATSTLANVPVDGGNPFPMVGLSSVSAAWASAGNPSWTLYEAVVSTVDATPDGSPDEVRVATTVTSAAVLPGLLPNATHHLFVRAVNWNGVASDWAALGATATRIETPSTVLFDAISSTTFLVRATTTAGGFSNLSTGAAAAGVFLDGAFQGFVSGSSVTLVSGLTANTSYVLKAKARNLAGLETDDSPAVSTFTLAAQPSTATPSFTGVGISSLALQWTNNGNPAGTEYRVNASTAADWTGSADATSSWFTGTSTSVVSLGVNATYYLRVRARNAHGLETAYTDLGSTATLAAVPGTSGTPFTSVAQASMTVSWSLGLNPSGTSFRVRGSTTPLFGGAGDVASDFLVGLSTGFTGLAPDATYYWRVAARSHGGILSDSLDAGTRATTAYDPGTSTAPFHRVWATSATVQWGSGGNPASTTYEVQAATSTAFTGAVRESGLVTFLSTTVTGLAGDATYYWRVRAKGVSGVNTDPLLFGSTATSAADPGPAAFAHVGPTAVRAQWGSGGNRDSDSTGVWATRTALPSARERHGTAYASGRAYVVGGLVGGSPSAEVWSVGLSPSGTAGAWRREADLPAPRESHALVADSGRLYVVGGFEGSAKATVFSADLAGDGSIAVWRSEPNLPAARSKLAAVSHGGWLYALGGDNGVVGQAAVYRAPMGVDGRVGAWAAATSLPAARNSHAAAVSGGRVYVAGGLGAGVEEEVWSAALAGPTVGAWQVQTPLPVPVFRHTLAASGGALLLVGGHDGNAAVAHVRSAPLGAGGDVGAWVELGAVPLARFGHGAVAEAGNLFLFGGADDSTAGADTFRTALGGTEYLLESAQDAGFGVAYGSSGWRAGSGGEVAGLTPNRTYHLRVRARSRAGTEGSLVVFGSTLTPAAVPGAAASTFSSVEAGSVTLAWADGGNPAGTEFLAALSTSTDFTAIRDTGWTAAVSSAVFGLSPNATYYAAVLARDSAGRLSREAFLGSTVTAAAAPQSPSFPSVVTTGLTVAWSTAGNPAGTRYEAQLASTPTFSALTASSVTLSSGASFANLLSATTYYLRVRAFNWAGTPSGFSAATQAVTGADFSPPSAVTGLAVHAGETPGVMLAAWTAPGDDGTAGVLAAGSRFYLQWSAADPALVAWSTASAQLSAATGPVTPGASASLVVTGLPIGASVYTRVWAEDESGNVSPPSSTAAAWASPFSLSRLDGATSDAGRSASVALDRSGDAHVAYTAGTITQELRYLKRTGGVWSVAEAPDSGVPAEDALVAVDAAGVPQILYRNSSTGQLRHARRSGAWQASAVATGDMRPGGLALDATGYAHISYYDSALPGLRYARWTGAAWEFEAVNAGPGVGRFSSLALDGAGTPHIAYHDAAGADLKHASRTAAGAWLTSTVDSAGAVGSSPTVVLDGEGRPTVFYVDGGAADLRSARFDGAAWTLSVVDSSAAVSGVGGAALDGAGRAVVSYHDAAAGDLLFARHDGTTWQLGAVDGYGDVGAWSGAAVEADGGLLLVHYASTGGDLRAATWTAGLAAPVGGNPRGRARAPAAFGGVVASSVSIQWTWFDTVPNELGWRLYGALASTGPFTVVAGSAAIPATPGTGTQRIFAESGLTAHTTYYRYVAAVSSGGTVVSPMAAVYPYTTMDLSAPAVVDNQAGDAVWRRAAGALYDVDFTDTGGSALERFSVKASTTAGGLGTDLIGFTDVVTSILSDSYTADWALPAAVFDALLDGATNYVTVRVADGNANAATLLDAFTVLKDTTPPVLADNQADDPVRRAAGGTAYDVDAFDGSSGLDRFQYSVSTAVGSADGGAVGWTDVVLGGGATFYQTNWTLDFAGLLGDATNYVSVRAWDRAGSTVSLADTFSVVKDTGGPRVVIQQPSAAVRSVLTVLSGTAADAAGVGGVQVALQDTPPGGVWFDGTGFTSGTPVWLAAAGTASWTFAGMPTLVDGTAYRVVARSTDSLGNFSVANTTSDFTFDASTPTAAVTVPTSGATLAVLPTLSGTAFDPGAGASGLSLIEVRVRRVSDGLYWNWSADAWGVPAVATTPVTASPWTLGVPAGLRANLAHGASYFVSARGVDNATPPNAGSLAVGSTFTWTDTTAPAAVTDLTALTGSAPGEIVLNWTAPGDDGSAGDIALAEYRVHYSTDSAAVFSTSSAQVAFSTANVKPGTYRGRVVAGLTSGATYHLRLFLADDSGNWSALSNGATVYAGIQPLSRITGFVRKASSEGITAVQLEAYNASDIRVSNAFSLADGSGTFSLDNIPDGVFRVQASWTADEITSSVWLDNVAVGTPEVVFTLEVSYTLSTLTGTLGTLSAQSASAPGFMVRAAENGFGQSRVELLRGGTTVAGVRPDPSGRWIIPNLLPGKYAVRAYNGLEFTDPVDVQLGEGETQEVVFVFDPLPEASVFAFPNPARTQTTFRFVSALPGLEAQVTVFDIAGNLVKELPGSAFVPKPGGLYHGVWDLTNDDGEAVASGVYLFMVKVKGSNGQSGKLIKKIAVVR